MDIRGYSLHEHSFRFAGWCAATAAGRSPNCRFTIETGMKILSISGVKEKFQTWDDLPDTENEFDELFDNKILKLVILSVLSIPFFISIYHNKSIYNYINSKDNLVKKNFDDDKFMYTYLNLNIGLKILLFILIAALFMLKPNNDE